MQCSRLEMRNPITTNQNWDYAANNENRAKEPDSKLGMTTLFWGNKALTEALHSLYCPCGYEFGINGFQAYLPHQQTAYTVLLV